MPSNRTLFISYRRDDSAGWAGRLEVDLRSKFGTDLQVFMDVDSISPGEDFARAIDDAVRRSDALVALIGPGWITAQDAQGRRRLDDPNDFVRVELESALRRDIRVIPALVGGASLPRQDVLPETLRDLTKRQAVKLDNETWSLGLSKLVRAIEPPSDTRARFAQLLRHSAGHRTVIAAGVALAVFAAIAVATALLQGGESPNRPEATTADHPASNDYPRYTRVRDDTGQLSFLAPSDWGNVYGNGWHPRGVPPYDGERIGPGVNAAPNVAAWMEDVTTPGVFVGASSRAVTARYDPKKIAERIGPGNSRCRTGRQDDFQSSYPITLTGIEQRSTCTGGSEWDTIAAWPEDHAYLVYVQIKLVTPRDHVARAKLLSSLLIKGAK